MTMPMRARSSRAMHEVVTYLRQNKGAVPDTPQASLGAFIDFMASEVNDGILTGDQTSLDRQITSRIIRAENVPNRSVASASTAAERRDVVKALQSAQISALKEWASFLFVADLPDSFKYWVWDALDTMGRPSGNSFRRRGATTVEPVPPLEPDAVREVAQLLEDRAARGVRSTDNFDTLYAAALPNHSSRNVIDFARANDYKVRNGGRMTPGEHHAELWSAFHRGGGSIVESKMTTETTSRQFLAVNRAGDRIGTALWQPHGDRIWLVGLDTNGEIRGAGAALIAALVAEAPSKAIILNASPRGRPFYEGIGFHLLDSGGMELSPAATAELRQRINALQSLAPGRSSRPQEAATRQL